MGNYRVYVYAICKNERAFAARWMQSMREADGVYVLDTGSTDGTPEALTELGAQVTCEEITPWRFDTARNRSLELVPADADICVCTDLDEYFTPGWREQVESAWAEGAQQLRYPYVWSFNADGSEGTFFYADKMHARQGFEWIHPVHEVLRYTGGGEAQRALCQGMRLEHHPDAQKSRAQYLPLLELAVQEAPQDDRSLHYLGREYLFHQRWNDCIATLKRHLALPSATWRDERCASMRYIARAYGARGNAYEQECYLLRAAGEAPHLREPWLDLARMYYARQNWPGVAYACERALQDCRSPAHLYDRAGILRRAAMGSFVHRLLPVGSVSPRRAGRPRSAVPGPAGCAHCRKRAADGGKGGMRRRRMSWSVHYKKLLH